VGDAAPAGAICRPAHAPCDAPEVCDGTSTECPDDELEAEGARCELPEESCALFGECSFERRCIPTDDPSAWLENGVDCYDAFPGTCWNGVCDAPCVGDCFVGTTSGAYSAVSGGDGGSGGEGGSSAQAGETGDCSCSFTRTASGRDRLPPMATIALAVALAARARVRNQRSLMG